ncbi:hypothetical protein RhiLY_10962 [Ceratobasidium sp. AG-Ba]|nr:hypothetical protein RhiLY_10962 [Ceratobasidium sp. AG-Ba]
MASLGRLFVNFALFGSLLADASPMGIEERAASVVCTKKFSGTLSTMEMVIGEGPALGRWQNLTINSNNEIAFRNNTTKRGIQAEFQACKPNYGGFSNNGQNNIWAGRIYLPELKKCLAVKNPNAADQRHYVEVRACPTPSAGKDSQPYNFVASKYTQIYLEWSGITNAAKTRTQGGSSCEIGTYGYLRERYNLPVPYENNRIKLACLDNPSAASFATLKKWN